MSAGISKERDWRSGFHFYRYSLAMRGGLRRDGVLLRLQNSDGRSGWGDAAPLPGWSVESLDDVLDFIANGGGSSEVPSSLLCAVEAARASMLPFHSSSALARNLPLNALLDGSPEDMIRQAVDSLSRGCECLKIKAAALSVRELVALVRRISGPSCGRCRFRIDSNRSWDFETALHVAESLREFPVDYLEEPLRDSRLLPELIEKSPLGIALDETLRETNPEGLAAYRGAVALVLKPTLMGGFNACARFAQAGAALGMATVVSACYESGVGIHALGQFALSLPDPAAAGLDTYSRLQEDVLCRRLDLADFTFHGDSPLPDVDISKLHPL